MEYIPDSGTVRLTLAGNMTSLQSGKTASLAKEASLMWEQEQHPGWSAAGVDSCPLMTHLEQMQVHPDCMFLP